MSPQIYLQIGITLLNLAFVAGGVYVVVKQTRKDLNGLGRKVRENELRIEDRYLLTVLAFVMDASADRQRSVAEWFLKNRR